MTVGAGWVCNDCGHLISPEEAVDHSVRAWWLPNLRTCERCRRGKSFVVRCSSCRRNSAVDEGRCLWCGAAGPPVS